ncbi:hypothetical protein [Vasconcelosia minhoensis]|nr:hypothetical protein [Romeria gracilis]
MRFQTGGAVGLEAVFPSAADPVPPPQWPFGRLDAERIWVLP